MFIIGIVNYKTSVYMETQLKIYRDFAGESFKVMIVDNSMNSDEFDRLQQVAAKFAIPINITRRNCLGEYGSAAHGNGLQHIYDFVTQNHLDAKYILMQDPDFFWVQPQFLTFLKARLQTFIAVGAPYHHAFPTIGGKHPWFPAAFGAAYNLSALKEINADFRSDTKTHSNRDVAWQIRDKLSHRPYYYFHQEPFEPVGSISFETISRKYTSENITIAYHLHRGSFEVHPAQGKKWSRKGRYWKQLQETNAPEEWQNNRKKMCEFFWQEINKAAKGS